jgi:predicted nicotinamide N-methyase
MSFQNASKDLFTSKQLASLKLIGGKDVDIDPATNGSLMKTGDLAVAGGVLIKKQLRVCEGSLFWGNLTAPTIINTTLHGNTVILHNLFENTVGGGIIIRGNLIPESANLFNLGSQTLFWNQLHVNDAHIYGDLEVFANTTLNSTLTVTGNTIINNKLTVDGNINVKCHNISNVNEIVVDKIIPKNQAINIGVNTNTSPTSKDIAIGKNTITIESIAIGFGAQANDPDSIAIGNGANTNEGNSIAIGFDSCSSGLNSIAIGKKTMSGTLMTPTLQETTIIGPTTGTIFTNVVKWQAFEIDMLVSLTSIRWYIDTGSSQVFPLTLSLYKGVGTVGTLLNTQEFTNGSTGVPYYDVLYDHILLQPGNYTFAYSPGASPMFWQYTSTVSGSLPAFLNIAPFAGTWLMEVFGSIVADKTIAIGADANTFSANSIAIGTESCTAAENAIAIGLVSHANETNSIAVGTNTTAHGVNSIALGSGAVATENDSVAILGVSASLTATASVWGQTFQNKAWNDGFVYIAIIDELGNIVKSNVDLGNVGGGGFVSPATANLDMDCYSINKVGRIEFCPTNAGIVIGDVNTTANGINSIALGRNAIVTKDHSVQIGEGVNSTTNATLHFRSQQIADEAWIGGGTTNAFIDNEGNIIRGNMGIGGWVSVASSNLDMNCFSINNVEGIHVDVIFSKSGSEVILSDSVSILGNINMNQNCITNTNCISTNTLTVGGVITSDSIIANSICVNDDLTVKGTETANCIITNKINVTGNSIFYGNVVIVGNLTDENGNVILGTEPVSIFKVVKTSNQSISSGNVATIVTFSSIDPNSINNLPGTWNGTDTFTISTEGWYQVSAAYKIEDGFSNKYVIQVFINGVADQCIGQSQLYTTGLDAYTSISCIVHLEIGDTVDIRATQTEETSQNITNAYLAIHYLPGTTQTTAMTIIGNVINSYFVETDNLNPNTGNSICVNGNLNVKGNLTCNKVITDTIVGKTSTTITFSGNVNLNQNCIENANCIVVDRLKVGNIEGFSPITFNDDTIFKGNVVIEGNVNFGETIKTDTLTSTSGGNICVNSSMVFKQNVYGNNINIISLQANNINSVYTHSDFIDNSSGGDVYFLSDVTFNQNVSANNINSTYIHSDFIDNSSGGNVYFVSDVVFNQNVTFNQNVSANNINSAYIHSDFIDNYSGGNVYFVSDVVFNQNVTFNQNVLANNINSTYIHSDFIDNSSGGNICFVSDVAFKQNVSANNINSTYIHSDFIDNSSGGNICFVSDVVFKQNVSANNINSTYVHSDFIDNSSGGNVCFVSDIAFKQNVYLSDIYGLSSIITFNDDTIFKANIDMNQYCIENANCIVVDRLKVGNIEGFSPITINDETIFKANVDLNTNSIVNVGSIHIGNVELTTIDGTDDTHYVLPVSDGTSGQVLQTNGMGILSFTTIGSADTIQASSYSIGEGVGSADAPFIFSKSNLTSLTVDVTAIRITIGGVRQLWLSVRASMTPTAATPFSFILGAPFTDVVGGATIDSPSLTGMLATGFGILQIAGTVSDGTTGTVKNATIERSTHAANGDEQVNSRINFGFPASTTNVHNFCSPTLMM